MHVWISKARKEATCAYCEKPILNNSYFVMCTWYMNTKGGKSWLKEKRLHPECWLEQGIAEVEKRSITETRGGRNRLVITDGDREIRMKILRKRAALAQRARVTTDMTKLLRLLGKMDKCKEEVMLYGGVPAKW